MGFALFLEDVGVKMKSLWIVALVVALSSCGTTSGLLNGSATVIEGFGEDLRSISDLFR